MVGAQRVTLRFGALFRCSNNVTKQKQTHQRLSGPMMISGPSYPALFSTSDFDIFFFASKCHLHF